MKILYAPILEGGAHHETAAQNKRGLYAALVKAGHWVMQWDYLDAPRGASMLIQLHELFHAFRPELVITQLHGADVITSSMIEDLRDSIYNFHWMNWSGDSHRHSLLGEAMLELMRHVDLLLVPTLDVLPDLEAAGIRARYWNIAYEEPLYPLPDMPRHDIVFQGNVFNDQRRALVEMLRSLPYNVGIYGDWEHADGNTVYNFAAQRVLYQNARLAIADNYRPDNLNYVSDRPMQIMASGGALCLHQHVDRMHELTGWIADQHYIEWNDLDELQRLIHYWLDPYMDRYLIVQQAKEQVERYHSFDARVEQLFRDYWPLVSG